jgi:hypothetical protein
MFIFFMHLGRNESTEEAYFSIGDFLSQKWKLFGMEENTFGTSLPKDLRRILYRELDDVELENDLFLGKAILGSVGQVINARVNFNFSYGANEKRARFYSENSFFTRDFIFSHPNGKSKLVLDFPYLLRLNKDTKIRDGAVLLDEGVYESTPGVEFDRRKYLERYNNQVFYHNNLDCAIVKSNPLLNFLFRDYRLLNFYTNRALALNKKKGKAAMGVDFGLVEVESPEMRGIVVTPTDSEISFGVWNNELVNSKQSCVPLFDTPKLGHLHLNLLALWLLDGYPRNSPFDFKEEFGISACA